MIASTLTGSWFSGSCAISGRKPNAWSFWPVPCWSCRSVAVATTLIASRGVGLVSSTTSADNAAYLLIPLALLVFGLIMWLANWVNRSISARAINDVMLELRSDAFTAATEP